MILNLLCRALIVYNEHVYHAGHMQYVHDVYMEVECHDCITVS